MVPCSRTRRRHSIMMMDENCSTKKKKTVLTQKWKKLGPTRNLTKMVSCKCARNAQQSKQKLQFFENGRKLVHRKAEGNRAPTASQTYSAALRTLWKTTSTPSRISTVLPTVSFKPHGSDPQQGREFRLLPLVIGESSNLIAQVKSFPENSGGGTDANTCNPRTSPCRKTMH